MVFKIAAFAGSIKDFKEYLRRGEMYAGRAEKSHRGFKA